MTKKNVPIKKFATRKPQAIISTTASDISVYVMDSKGVERENVYSDVTPSDFIAQSTAADLNIPVTPTYQKRFVEQLDVIKTQPYLKEVEFELKGPELKWPPSLGSLKVTIKKGLRVIKSYKKEV